MANNMRVIETDRSAQNGLRFSSRPIPAPRHGLVGIRVECVSVNRGEAKRAQTGLFDDGMILGWDAAGTVTSIGDAVDPSLLGKRVVAKASMGTWAEYCLADVKDIAVIPSTVSAVSAVAVAIAGSTALAGLTRNGAILGRTVLITGASGSVGQFALQLARMGGANVIALVNDETSVERLRSLGADRIVTQLDDVPEVDLIVETLGGPTLVQCARLLAAGGSLQSIGWSSGVSAVFTGPALLTNSTSIQGLTLGQNHVGAYFETLVKMLERGRLDPCVKWQGSWDSFSQAIELVMSRGLHGKAVMQISSEGTN
jgi:NADPH2:quinone reductase